MEELDREKFGIPPSATIVRAVGEIGVPDKIVATPGFMKELIKLDEAEREQALEDRRDGVIL